MSGFRLRAQETGETAAEFALLMRPALRHGTMVFAPFTSAAEGRAFLENDKPAFGIVAVTDPGDAWIGQVLFFRNRKFSDHSGSCGIAVHEDWHRRGVGSALMAAMLDTAENWLGISRISLNVFTDNEPAIALYRKFRFEIEGTMRRHTFRDGTFIDTHLMARLREPPCFASAS